MSVMCPEPRCGQSFACTLPFRVHWTDVHRTTPRALCPLPVQLAAEKKRKRVDDNTGPVVSVLDLIKSELSCSDAAARACYQRFFRLPEVVKLGILFHRHDEATGAMAPIVYADRAWLLTPFIRADIQQDALPPALPPALPLVEVYVPPTPPPSPALTATALDRINVVAESVAVLQHVLSQVAQLTCDDHAKDALRHMALRAVAGPAFALDPPVVVGAMVQEHLGYMPITVQNGQLPVKDLLLSIGREAKRVYIERHGRAPEKRTFSHGEDMHVCNNYTSMDKLWIKDIVVQQCAKFKVSPRPRLLMARGMPIGSD